MRDTKQAAQQAKQDAWQKKQPSSTYGKPDAVAKTYDAVYAQTKKGSK